MLINEKKIRNIIRKNLYKEYLINESNGTSSQTNQVAPSTSQIKNYNSLNDIKYWKDFKTFKINNYSLEEIQEILKELKEYYRITITGTQWNSSIRNPSSLDIYGLNYPKIVKILGTGYDIIKDKEEKNEAINANIFKSISQIDLNDINNLNKFKFNIENTIIYDLFSKILNDNNLKKELNIIKYFYFKYIENLFKDKGLEGNQIEAVIKTIKDCDNNDDNFKEVLLFPLNEFEFDNNKFSESLVEFQNWVNKSKVNNKALDKSYFFKEIYPLTTKPGISIYGPGKSEFVILALINDSTSGGGKSHDIVFKGANAGNEIELKQGNQKFVSIQLNIKKEEDEDKDEEDEEDIDELEEDASTIYEEKRIFNDTFNKFQNNFKNYTSEINDIFEISNSLSQKIWENYVKDDGTLKPAFVQTLYPKLPKKPAYSCNKFIQEISTFVSQNLNKYKSNPPKTPKAQGPSNIQKGIAKETAKNFNELFSNDIISGTDQKVFSDEAMKKMSMDFLNSKGVTGKKIFILGNDKEIFEDPDNSSEKIRVFEPYNENNITHKKFKNLFMTPEDLYQLIRKKMERINLYRKEQLPTMIQISKTDLNIFLGYYVENVFNIQLKNLEYFKDHLESIKNSSKVDLTGFKFDKSTTKDSSIYQQLSAVDNFIHKVNLGNEELRITFKKYDASSRLVKEKEIISNINNFKIVNPIDPNKDIKIDEFLDTNKDQNYSLVFNDIEMSHENFQKIINQKNMFSYLYPEITSTTTTTPGIGSIKAPKTQNLLKDIDDLLIKLLDIHISIEESYSKGGKGALAYSGEQIDKSGNTKTSNGILADSFKVVFPNPDVKYRGVYKKLQDYVKNNTIPQNWQNEIDEYKRNNVPFINKLGARDLNIDSNDSGKAKSFLEIILDLREKIIKKQTEFNNLLSEINNLLGGLK